MSCAGGLAGGMQRVVDFFDVRNVDGRMERRCLSCWRLDGVGVDRGQDWLRRIAGRVHRGADLFVCRHGCGGARGEGRGRGARAGSWVLRERGEGRVVQPSARTGQLARVVSGSQGEDSRQRHGVAQAARKRRVWRTEGASRKKRAEK